jgi:hypothetical protein
LFLEEMRLDPERAHARNTFLQILGPDSSQRLVALEASIGRAAVRATGRSLAPRNGPSGVAGGDVQELVPVPRDEVQIGVLTSRDTLLNCDVENDGTLVLLENELRARPFLHSPPASVKAAPASALVPPALEQALHLYTQFVMFAVQKVPMAVCAVLLAEQIRAKRTVWPAAVAAPVATRSPALRALVSAHTAIVEYYDVIAAVVEEFVLQQIGYDVTGYEPERLRGNPALSFCRSLRSFDAGLFNLLANWTQFLVQVHKGSPAQKVLKSLCALPVSGL